MSMPSRTPPALTKLGWRKNAGFVPAASISSGEKNEIPSTPARRFSQNSSMLAALGNRPLIPTMASASGEAVVEVLISPSLYVPSPRRGFFLLPCTLSHVLHRVVCSRFPRQMFCQRTDGRMAEQVHDGQIPAHQ